ncbi:methyltransferase family protein [Brevibacterium sanguinis]|uniref:Methyltransferase family protein n=2 Tax=Brevibacterium TaxID=1696 RepID=A0A366IQD8_9MICO|nr:MULTISPECIES: class I SAM-dependent methyltransferase [Brevibacterium]RBP67861.1 methyltransferase family protein [Brevibacterium sanguinis]RBP74722.1 methyltransferase family protein [Brevibacterium celere]
MTRISGTDFGTAASEYQRGRPGYPARSASWLRGDAEAIADIGAGTGKLTQALLGGVAGSDGAAGTPRITAIDPDERMLAALSSLLPEVDTRQGTGESLPLEDASVDLVAYGQSWHWVDPQRACAEAARVLRPSGSLGLIWNIRDESVDWVAELTGIITASTAEEYVSRLLASGPGSPDSVGNPLTGDFEPPEVHREEWSRTITVDQLVDMVASRSHTISLPAADRTAMLEEVRRLGERVRGASDTLDLPYVTYAFRAVPRR